MTGIATSSVRVVMVVVSMFSVGRESMSGVFVLAVVVNATDENPGNGGGVSAVGVSDRLDCVRSVEVSSGEVGSCLRALQRQGFVKQEGVRFVATTDGCERVEGLVRDVGRVAGENGSSGEERPLLVE